MLRKPTEPRKAARPSGELWPVGKWQAEKLANHRKRQRSRVPRDEIGRTSLYKELIGKLAGDRTDAGRHIEDGSPTKRFLDDPPQPAVIRLVDGQHIFGKDSKYARHPPAQPGDGAVVRANLEGAEHPDLHLADFARAIGGLQLSLTPPGTAPAGYWP